MKWTLKKNKKIINEDHNYIGDSITNNLLINEGINYLIGKNNSGKTKIMNLINEDKFDLFEDVKKITVNKIYLRSSSNIIMGYMWHL